MANVALLSTTTDFQSEIVKALESIDATIYVTSRSDDPRLSAVDVILWYVEEGDQDIYDYLHTICPRVICLGRYVSNIHHRWRYTSDLSKLRLNIFLPSKPEDFIQEDFVTIVTGALLRPRI
ncbi:MAG: hypothetical protein ACJ8CR_10620 [Roseiflexaceae bacterium]